MSSKLSAFSALNGYCVYNNRCDGEYRVCRNNFGRDVNNKKREKIGFNQISSFFSATATESRFWNGGRVGIGDDCRPLW